MASSCQFSSKQRQAEEWKALNDTIMECSQKISNIVGVIQMSPHTTEETQKSLQHEIDSIDRRMKQAVHVFLLPPHGRHCMERNKDNDLGKYLRENYKEE